MMHPRIKDDAYYTPEWCYLNIEPLINWPKIKSALEPCYGDGRIYNYLKTKVPLVHGVNPDFDFTKSIYTDWDLVFTNPPYNQAKEFVEKSLASARTVIMLLRLSFLGSQDRYKLFKDNPLHALYVLSKRPSFAFGGTDNSEYAWFVWDRAHVTTAGIHHIITYVA